MSRTAEWRKIEREYIAEAAAALPDFNPCDPVHVAQLFLGDWDTPPTEEEVLRCAASVATEMVHEATSQRASLAAADKREEESSKAVKNAVQRLLTAGKLPAPRNLVSAIIAMPEVTKCARDRKTVARALRRLALDGGLPEKHAAYWSRPPKPRS